MRQIYLHGLLRLSLALIHRFVPRELCLTRCGRGSISVFYYHLVQRAAVQAWRRVLPSTPQQGFFEWSHVDLMPTSTLLAILPASSESQSFTHLVRCSTKVEFRLPSHSLAPRMVVMVRLARLYLRDTFENWTCWAREFASFPPRNGAALYSAKGTVSCGRDRCWAYCFLSSCIGCLYTPSPWAILPEGLSGGRESNCVSSKQ